MADRCRVWLGAGVLAGGVSAAMLAGAGVANADDATSSGNQVSSGSNDADSKDLQASSAGSAAKPAPDKAVDTSDGEKAAGRGKHRRKTEGDERETQPSRDDAAGDHEDNADDEDAEESGDAHIDTEGGLSELTPEPAAAGRHAAPEFDEPEPSEEDSEEEGVADAATPSGLVSSVETDLSSDDGAMVMTLAAASTDWPGWTAPNLFTVFDDICTGFYNWYTGAMQFIAGPARAPFGSRVRVETSDLTIGDDVVVQADWYFPPGSAEPKGLIYLQHGLWATSRFYSATAAYLAEKTHSIVVAPTLTWNPFDAEHYALMLPGTHRAIAALFAGDRAALEASAMEAGYRGSLPTRVVLAGHSAGGGLVAGTARYMVRRGLENDLAGVVMLDGVGVFGRLRADLAKIPDSIPVYNLAAAANMWNSDGYARRKLQEVRPDMFTGVLVKGGHHSDSMQSTSGAVQFMAYLATGFSSQWNVAANQLLSAGWINDMLNGTHTAGLYSSNVSPVNLVADAWRHPAATTRTIGTTAYRADATSGCPVGAVSLSCADESAGVLSGRHRKATSAL